MRSPVPESVESPVSRPSVLTLVLVLGALTALGPATIDMYLPSLPAIQQELGASPSLVQLTLAAYFIGLALGQLVYGPMSDRFGRKRPLYAGLGLYVAASIGCALAPTIHALVALRFVQALGGAAGQVIPRAVVRDLHVGAAAARTLALLMLVMGVAPILAPLVGGAILLVSSFRAIFVLLAVLGVACLLLMVFALPETSRTRTPLDVAVITKNLGEVLRDRRFTAHSLTAAFAWAGMFAYISGSPFVLIQLFGVSPQHYGWIFGTNAFALVLGTQIGHRLLRRFTPGAVVSAATPFLLVAGGGLVFVTVANVGGVTSVCAGLLMYLGTIGFIAPNATALAMDDQGGRAGLASAAFGAMQLGIAAVVASMVGALNDGSARPMAMVMAGCAASSFIASRVARGPSALGSAARRR